jgi:hypothetical protein
MASENYQPYNRRTDEVKIDTHQRLQNERPDKPPLDSVQLFRFHSIAQAARESLFGRHRSTCGCIFGSISVLLLS